MERPDIEFVTWKGKRVKLIFQKNEYRAYMYDSRFDRWEDMKLGGLDTKVLTDYISERF